MTIAMSLDAIREETAPRSLPVYPDPEAAPVDPRRLSAVELVPVAVLRAGDWPAPEVSTAYTSGCSPSSTWCCRRSSCTVRRCG